MCGIAGLIRFDAPEARARDLVEGMVTRIRHRGPDGGGVTFHPDATLGMARLAIVDTVGGQQPMANDDGSIVIVFNGEIYNAPALRKELEAEGVRFRTRSDTEVILRLYERDPADVERHLVGMWAFVIHDRGRRRVVLSRDRFGIKPFFVADTGRALAFASELQCFDRSLPGFAPLFAVDPAAAHAMVSWSYVPETATIFRGVTRLAPATRCTIDLVAGTRTTETYWRLAPSADAGRIAHLDEACSEVERLLRRAVREHLESDLPVATFLSGGIDSSLISAYAKEASSRPLKAYAIGFEDERFDESPYARMTAERLGVPIEVKVFDEETARNQVADVLAAYDEPFGDSSSLATYLVSGLVARDYKVVLGGDGGDEVFAGYKKYLIVKLRKPFSYVPSARNAIARALGTLPTRTTRATVHGELLRTARRLSRGLGGDDAQIYAALTQITPLARTTSLMREPRLEEASARFLGAAEARFEGARGSELQRTLTCDLGSTLPNDMLVKVDRASMAHRLEARVPFLDHRVVEFGVGLPERFTLGWNGKRVLRTLHERLFGHELAHREKHGFGVPVERWLTGPFDGACERLFERKRLDRYGVLSAETLSNGGHRAWARTDPMVLWHAFALAAWCEVHLGGGRGALQEIFDASNARPRDAYVGGAAR